nr:MAG TPA: hypothetical protein [Caudoviricetes sp.]
MKPKDNLDLQTSHPSWLLVEINNMYRIYFRKYI